MELARGITVRLQLMEWAIALFGIYRLISPRMFDDGLKCATNHRLISRFLLIYLAMAFMAKLTQYLSLSMNAQDFWLFIDMFETFKLGQPGVTHFAGQAWGPMQQGVIHPFVTWLALTPLTYVFGGVGVGLLFNPLCFALAGWMLNRLAQHLGLKSEWRFLLVLAFLFSRQSSLTVMYEVHPEALYPLLSFGMVYALIRESWWQAFAWGVVLGLLKEDSFMVVWGCGIAAWFLKPGLVRKLPKVMGVFGASALAYWVQVWLIQYFNRNAYGGVIPSAGVLVGNHKWDSLSSIGATVQALLEANGGLSGTLAAYGRFLISDSWRGILFTAPWVALSPGFWLAEIPLTFSFSLRGTNAVFWNYYSVPFIAFFWIFLIKQLASKVSIRWPLAVVVLSLLNGSESLVITIPNAETLAIRQEAGACSKQVESLQGKGVVLARLIPFVPLSKVISDRLPGSSEEEARVGYYFLTKDLTSYSIALPDLKAKIESLKRPDSGFRILCETDRVILLGRKE